MSVQIGNGLLMVVAPGTLTVGSARARLIRQVTLADFCEPQAERPGLVVLALRHPADLIRLIPAKGTRVNCCSRQSVRADRICYSIRRLTSHVLF